MDILFDSSVQKPKAKNGSSRFHTEPPNDGPEIPKSHEFIVNNAHKNVSIFSFDKGKSKQHAMGCRCHRN